MNLPILRLFAITAMYLTASCGHIVAPPRDGFDPDAGGELCDLGGGPWPNFSDSTPPASTVQCHPWQRCTALPVVGFECRP